MCSTMSDPRKVVYKLDTYVSSLRATGRGYRRASGRAAARTWNVCPMLLWLLFNVIHINTSLWALFGYCISHSGPRTDDISTDQILVSRNPFWAVFEGAKLSWTLLSVAILGVKTFTGSRLDLWSRWNELPGVGVHCVSPRCTSCDSVLSF